MSELSEGRFSIIVMPAALENVDHIIKGPVYDDNDFVNLWVWGIWPDNTPYPGGWVRVMVLSNWAKEELKEKPMISYPQENK